MFFTSFSFHHFNFSILKLKHLFWCTKCQAYKLTNKTKKLYFSFLWNPGKCLPFVKLFDGIFCYLKNLIWYNKTQISNKQFFFSSELWMLERFGWIWNGINMFADFDGFIIIMIFGLIFLIFSQEFSLFFFFSFFISFFKAYTKRW